MVCAHVVRPVITNDNLTAAYITLAELSVGAAEICKIKSVATFGQTEGTEGSRDDRWLLSYFCRGQDCCFLGPRRPSANLIPAPGTRPPRRSSPAGCGREAPAPVGGAPRPCLRFSPALGAQLGNPRVSPVVRAQSRHFNKHARVPMRSRSLGVQRSRRTNPGGGASFNPCQNLTFPKLEIPEPQPLSH